MRTEDGHGIEHLTELMNHLPGREAEGEEPERRGGAVRVWVWVRVTGRASGIPIHREAKAQGEAEKKP